MAIRVLHIVTTLNRGGLETMLMNYYRNIDRNKVQFDFLLHREDKSDYEDEAKSLGANIYRVPALNPFSPAYYKALNVFFSEHHYDIVHCHLDCMSAVPLSVAKKHGVKHRIAHAHNVNQVKDSKYLIKLVFKRLIPLFSNNLFACGNEAGDWMYSGKKFTVLNNAINAESYTYNRDLSVLKKQDMGIENKFVIGHVGRFTAQKNHEFILNIFREVVCKHSDSVLVFIGTGDDEDNIKDKVKQLGLSDKVLFCGVRNDVNECLQAFDLFLFPSLFEGLSLACVEAQAAGLPCILSDSIPKECKITEDVKFISLNEKPQIWADSVIEYVNYERKDTFSLIRKSGFDITKNAKWLENFYLDKVNK